MPLNCSVGETLESPLDCKEIQQVHSKDQPWDFFGRNDAKAEAPVLWPPHAKSWFIEKDSDVGRDCGQEEKGMTEDEMAGWHHWLDGCESEWTQGVGDGQGGLACCDSWGHKESDRTEWLNWTEEMVNSVGKESACNAGDPGSIPGLGRSPGEGKGYTLQYSGLENSTDCIVHGIAKSRTRLGDFHFHFQWLAIGLEVCIFRNLFFPSRCKYSKEENLFTLKLKV